MIGKVILLILSLQMLTSNLTRAQVARTSQIANLANANEV
jgi:hypothetical protein